MKKILFLWPFFSFFCFLFFFFSFFLFLEAQELRLENDHSRPLVYAMGPIGGDPRGDLPDFLRVLHAFHYNMQSFGVDEFATFFGNGNGLKLYDFKVEGLAEDFSKLKKDFILKTNFGRSCSEENLKNILEVFSEKSRKYNLIEYKDDELTNTKALGDLSRSRRGPSSKKALREYFLKALEELSSGDHLLLELSSHGKRTMVNWYAGLGASYDLLSAKDLKYFTDKFNEKGINVHLNIFSCYSGFLTQALSTYEEGANTCVLTSSSDDTASYSSHPQSDPLFKTISYNNHFGNDFYRFRNQLQAHTCAAAKDYINRPNTSLDALVTHFERPEQDIGIVARIHPLRKILKDAYKEYILDIREECAKDVSDADIKEDLEFIEAVKECYKTQCISSNQENSSMEMSKAICEESQSIFKTFSQAPLPDYNEHLKFRYELFFTYAGIDDLLKFKNAFCCLAFDFKERTLPKFCKEEIGFE